MSHTPQLATTAPSALAGGEIANTLAPPTEATARVILGGILEELSELTLQLEQVIDCGTCAAHSDAIRNLNPSRLRYWSALADCYLASANPEPAS